MKKKSKFALAFRNPTQKRGVESKKIQQIQTMLIFREGWVSG